MSGSDTERSGGTGGKAATFKVDGGCFSFSLARPEADGMANEKSDCRLQVAVFEFGRNRMDKLGIGRAAHGLSCRMFLHDCA